MTFEEELGFIVLQTNRDYVMNLKTQGLAQQLGVFVHKLNLNAGALGAKIHDLEPRANIALQKGHNLVDAAGSHVGEIESFVTEMEAVTNGPPAIESDPSRKPLTTFP